MKLEPVDLRPSQAIRDLTGKRISFDLPHDDTNEAAEGIGYLHVTTTADVDIFHVYISVDVWPESGGTGVATFYRFYLDKDELNWICPAPAGADYEIECIRPSSSDRG